MATNYNYIDITNHKFGSLTSISLYDKKRYVEYWNCKCDCGCNKIIRKSDLLSGHTKTCGNKIHRTEDISGKKFGRLTAIKFLGKDKNNLHIWECFCECGNKIKVLKSSLKKGNTKSCGCYNKELVKKIHTKHNNSRNPIYTVYHSMIQRCINNKNTNYKNYGARGIKICDEWLDKENGFISFYNWAIENRYKENLTIDRINNDSNYEPSNCRWVDMKTQHNNKRTNYFIEYKGENHTIAEWSEIYNINYSTLRNRLKKTDNLFEVFNKNNKNRIYAI